MRTAQLTSCDPWLPCARSRLCRPWEIVSQRLCESFAAKGINSMARGKKSESGGWALLKTVAKFAVPAGAVVGAVYLATGAGSKKNSPFIPDSIENELDKVADALTRRFGDGWIEETEHALMAVVPLPLRPLVAILRDAKTAGMVGGWDWPQTRAHAAKLHRERGSTT